MDSGRHLTLSLHGTAPLGQSYCLPARFLDHQEHKFVRPPWGLIRPRMRAIQPLGAAEKERLWEISVTGTIGPA